MTSRFLVFPSKPLFIPNGLYFIKRHVWRVKLFHKTVHKALNFFNLSEQSLENSAENPVSQFSIVHLENSRTWIFTLWNNIFQTQTSLLQPILVYTYRTTVVDVIAIDRVLAWCSSKTNLAFDISKSYFIYFNTLFYNRPNITSSIFWL